MRSTVIVKKPSENFADTPITPTHIILHCIGYSEERALNILTQKKSNAWSHYFVPQRELNSIANTGYPVYQLVPDTQSAFHAGKSRWKNLESFNDLAIGIEFHCPNYANVLNSAEPDWLHFEAFPDAQITAGIELLQSLLDQYSIPPENILAHSDIAPDRKTDPGATFPWEKLARAGIGVWPRKERTRVGELNTSANHVQTLLQQVGYAIVVNGNLDEPTRQVIRAFQWHFMPEQANGQISSNLVVRLENLIDKQYQYEPRSSLSFSSNV